MEDDEEEPTLAMGERRRWRKVGVGSGIQGQTQALARKGKQTKGMRKYSKMKRGKGW
jgi:hypothetical protein